MSFDLNYSRIDVRLEKPIAPGQSFPEEGMIAVRVDNGGEEATQPSLGTAADDPIGFVIRDTTSIVTKVWMEEVTVPVAGGTVNLEKANLATGSIRAVGATAGVFTVTEDTGSPGAGGTVDVALVNGVADFNVADAGDTVTFTYRYSPSVTELQSIKPRPRSVNNGAQDLYSSVTIGAGKCEVFTDQYETDQAYAIGDQLYTGANGKWTSDATSTVEFGKVSKVPSVGSPYLGVAFNV